MDEIFGPAALAIYAGELDSLRTLLRDQPDLATLRSSCSHPTLLQLVACEAANLPDAVGAARVLVDAGAEAEDPLVAAAGCGSRSVLEFLLDAGAPVDGRPAWTTLDEALYWSNTDIAALLVERGAHIRALSTAAALGDLAAIKQFFDESGALLPSAGPVASPFPDTVPADLAHNRQAILNHAFVSAVNNGHSTVTEFLLAKGAQVNVKPPGFHWHGTALHAAVWRNDRALVEWLLSHGADRTIQDDMAHSNAHGWALHHGHTDLAAFLAPSS